MSQTNTLELKKEGVLDIETKQVVEISQCLDYVMYSDYVHIDYDNHEIPLNPILVAPPGHGKTAITDRYKGNDGLFTCSKITEWSLLRNYLEDLKTGAIKRLYFPDLVNPANMRAETVHSLITFLNSYISWEGVKTISTYAGHFEMALFKPLRGSLMTTMASADFTRMYKGLSAVGFLSRLLIIGYHYDEKTINKILNDMTGHQQRWSDRALGLPAERLFIHAESSFLKRLIPLALRLGKLVPGYQIRAYQQMELLSKARALSEGRDTINEGDVEWTLYFFDTYVLKVPSLDPATASLMFKEGKDER